MSNINVHLTVIVSLRVPYLLAYNLSNLDVILLLFYLLYVSPNLIYLPLYSFYTLLGSIVK